MARFNETGPYRLLGLTMALGYLSLATIASAAPAKSAGTQQAIKSPTAKPAVNHSAPYTRLLGTDWPSGPVKFADRAAPAAAAKVPARNVGFRHWGSPYYAGYGGFGGYAGYGGFGGYGGPYGFGYTYPYYAGYTGYPFGAWNVYRPYVYSYQPWIGGWSGYPNYSMYPGFGGYQAVGYRGYGGYYGGYGGCCYW